MLAITSVDSFCQGRAPPHTHSNGFLNNDSVTKNRKDNSALKTGRTVAVSRQTGSGSEVKIEKYLTEIIVLHVGMIILASDNNRT